jgi:hypothetical protein
MLTPQAMAAPGLSANGLGIRIHSMGGQRFIEHAGENRNALMFLPDQRFGVYLVTTRHVYADALYPTFRAIAATWFDLPLEPASPARPADPAARQHAGLYLDGRLVEGVTWRLGAAFAKPDTAGARVHREIAFDEGGYLTLDGARFTQVSPGLFRALDKRQSRTGELQWLKLAILRDGTRTATLDMAAMLKLPRHRHPATVRTLIGGLGLLLTGLTILVLLRRRPPLLDRLLAVAAAAGALALPAIAFAYFRAGDRFVVEAAPEPLLLTAAPWCAVAALPPGAWLGWQALRRGDKVLGLWAGCLALLLGTLSLLSMA